MTIVSDEPHGILVVDKPRGPTSHDIVAQARRWFGTRRVGHGGTLDPMATGVLVLLLGEATKLCEIVAGSRKTYLAEVSFGRATDSHDSMGRVTDERAVAPGWLGEAELTAALELERQRGLQLPPAVSALKVGGRRAHELVRGGVSPVLAPRAVQVFSLELGSWGPDRACLSLAVSKGYYVRALARDIGETLGVPAHLSALRRVQSGDFTLAEAVAWPPREPPPLQKLGDALPRLVPTLRLSAAGVLRARRGQVLGAGDFIDEPRRAGAAIGSDAAAEPLSAWLDPEGTPVALGYPTPDGFRVRRGFSAKGPPPELEGSPDPSWADPSEETGQTRSISKS